eukprot:g12062.t1
MPKFTQKELEDSSEGASDLFSFGFEDPSQESDDVQHSNGKRKLGSLDPISKGPAVARGPLKPHQAGVFERMKAGMAHPSFASSRAKLGEIAREAAKARDMGDETSTEDVLREACGEYHPQQVLALDQLPGGALTPTEMLESGVEMFDRRKDYGVKEVNYMHFYVCRSKQPALDMIGKWESQMGVGASLCGSLRAKVNGHDWDNSEPLRLGISGEGLSASAHKYAKGLQNPPTPARARQPRQVNGRVANDGPAWLVPAGLVLAGEGAIDTVGTETYVWKTGDSNRWWREIHEAIGAVVFLKGLVWSPESVGLNQKVGGTFTDEQRSRGGAVQSGEHRNPNSNPRGPGGAGIEFDYDDFATSLGPHFRGQKNKKTGKVIISDNRSEFFVWSIPSVNNGEPTLGTMPFDSNGDNTRASYPCRKDGARIETAPKTERGNLYLRQMARAWHKNAQG